MFRDTFEIFILTTIYGTHCTLVEGPQLMATYEVDLLQGRVWTISLHGRVTNRCPFPYKLLRPLLGSIFVITGVIIDKRSLIIIGV